MLETAGHIDLFAEATYGGVGLGLSSAYSWGRVSAYASGYYRGRQDYGAQAGLRVMF